MISKSYLPTRKEKLMIKNVIIHIYEYNSKKDILSSKEHEYHKISKRTIIMETIIVYKE